MKTPQAGKALSKINRNKNSSRPSTVYGFLVASCLGLALFLVPLTSYNQVYDPVKLPLLLALIAAALVAGFVGIMFSATSPAPQYRLAIRAAAPLAPALALMTIGVLIGPHPGVWIKPLLFIFAAAGFAFALGPSVADPTAKRIIGLGFASGAFAVAGYAALQYFGILDLPFDKYGLPDVSSTLGLSNFVAAYLSPALFLAVYFFLGSKEKIKIFYAIAAALSIAALLMTGVRAVYLSTAAAAATWVLFFLLYRQKISPGARIKIAALLAGLMILAGYGGQTAIAFKMKSAQQSEGSLRFRIGSWQQAAKIGADNPIIGAGPGGFAIQYPKYQKLWFDHVLNKTSLMADNPHSEAARFFAESGAPGLLAFAFIFAAIFYFCAGAKSFGKNAALAAAAAAIAADALVDFPLLQTAPIMLLGLISALAAAESLPEREWAENGGGRIKAAGLGIAVLFVLISVGSVYYYGLPHYHRYLGKRAVKAAQFPQAKDYYGRALSRGGSIFYFNFEAGIAALKNGDTDRAVSLFEKTLELAPYHGRAALLLAQIEVQRSQFQTALAHFDLAERYSPMVARSARRFKLIALDGVGDTAAAIELGRKVYSDDKRPEIAQVIGRNMIRAGRLGEAKVFLETALIGAPDHTGLLWEMTRAHAAAGDPRAAGEIEQLLAAHPSLAGKAAGDGYLAPYLK